MLLNMLVYNGTGMSSAIPLVKHTYIVSVEHRYSVSVEHRYSVSKTNQVTKEAFIYCQMRKKKNVGYLHKVHVKRYSMMPQPLVSIKRPMNVIVKKGNPKEAAAAIFTSVANCLLAVPHSGDLGVSHLLLQLEDTEHEGFGGGRAAGDVNVDGDDAVTAAGDGVGVVVVTATVGA